MRLFVGVAPPPTVLDDLDAACAPLRPLRDDLRWTNRPAWHITLAFLGEVTDLSVTRLLPRLAHLRGRGNPSVAGASQVTSAPQDGTQLGNQPPPKPSGAAIAPTHPIPSLPPA